MKIKLSVASLLLCASFLFTACGNKQAKPGTVQAIHADDVPSVIMDNLVYSPYGNYKIESIQKEETDKGTIYTFKLSHDNNDVTLSFDKDGQLIE